MKPSLEKALGNKSESFPTLKRVVEGPSARSLALQFIVYQYNETRDAAEEKKLQVEVRNNHKPGFVGL